MRPAPLQNRPEVIVSPLLDDQHHEEERKQVAEGLGNERQRRLRETIQRQIPVSGKRVKRDKYRCGDHVEGQKIEDKNQQNRRYAPGWILGRGKRSRRTRSFSFRLEWGVGRKGHVGLS